MPDPVLERVDQQIHWYDRHATSARIWYCSIKITQIILAAAVPVAAGLDFPKLVTGSLGGLIVILEGIQQLFRYHDNWVRYRWTASAMEIPDFQRWGTIVRFLCSARLHKLK